MVLKLFNTLGRKKQTFVPIKDKAVGIYSCGPTVYWYPHLGNLRTYIFSDVLKRVLIYDGYMVKHVMNITDVGHLTSDGDEGEDKIEKAAREAGKKAEDIANYYFKVFKNNLEKLNIIEPDIWCKASEHIKEQIELIKILEKKGYTYRTADGIYFDSSKFKDYGKLALLKKEGLKAGKRVALGEKRNKTDFALWKFSQKPGLRQQEWDPKEFGLDAPIGFPGWHIECSAMSSKYLGEQFDIHTGAEDHIPVHHTNEIAQSESAFEKKPWVKYWIHGAFLMFKNEKMSKSKGEIYTLSEIEERRYSPIDYRYFCLSCHYRKQLGFSFEALDAARNSLKRLKNIISNLKEDREINKRYLTEFEKAINDDLDTPKALAVLWKMLRDEKSSGKIRTIEQMDKVFGLDLLKKEKVDIPLEVQKLIEERDFARKKKNWKKSDEIREKIRKMGFSLDDTENGTKVSRI